MPFRFCYCKLIPLLLIGLLFSCAEPPHQHTNNITPELSSQQRAIQLTALTRWQLTGKIAFIYQDKRESANLNWQKKGQDQQLNLTTYLGINVFRLTTEQGIHTIEVDDKSYQSDDLNQLVWQLSDRQLPVEALSYWIKGLAYSANDNIVFHNQLPHSLTSNVNGQQWHVSYDSYQQINQYLLPNLISLKLLNQTQNNVNQGNINSPDVLIKIRISQWTI